MTFEEKKALLLKTLTLGLPAMHGNHFFVEDVTMGNVKADAVRIRMTKKTEQYQEKSELPVSLLKEGYVEGLYYFAADESEIDKTTNRALAYSVSLGLITKKAIPIYIVADKMTDYLAEELKKECVVHNVAFMPYPDEW